jgi:hypothetical protein
LIPPAVRCHRWEAGRFPNSDSVPGGEVAVSGCGPAGCGRPDRRSPAPSRMDEQPVIDTTVAVVGATRATV